MSRILAVLGAGTMGHGIAHVAAVAGWEVRLRDVAPELVERGLAAIRRNLDKGVEKGKVQPAERDAAVARIRGTSDLKDAVAGADVVIEAIPESLALKQETFAKVETLAPLNAVLATNTSSIPIGAIAGALSPRTRPRVVGMHFFNPPHLMKLIEVVRGPETAHATVDFAVRWAIEAGKEPIVVKDSPGFATSRLGIALGLEAIRMLEEGVASAEDLDKAMTLGYNHPMGPLRLTDLVGLDVRLAIAEHLAREIGPRFEPPALLREMVKEGRLGQKSGRGFYSWQ